ncbi:hypothetical protein M406DRAFT_101699 [Cryphonectria parasitica EP155]|uniref:Uncharacterized protein n=1 Tax=Cryphonectria parasitica (strain ATCC 38755 / EP155) TaxID=660469 RepID=A0A9P4Y3T2_CRYP1|nr:uncharacterized protein M406DRAFT_101699 [Cryphonectria parasitica EP155]KAF3766419.1 hypothetical protein M406DRAFT_101699 [Cryphonectria parasitica EP155]
MDSAAGCEKETRSSCGCVDLIEEMICRYVGIRRLNRYHLDRDADNSWQGLSPVALGPERSHPPLDECNDAIAIQGLGQYKLSRRPTQLRSDLPSQAYSTSFFLSCFVSGGSWKFWNPLEPNRLQSTLMRSGSLNLAMYAPVCIYTDGCKW